MDDLALLYQLEDALVNFKPEHGESKVVVYLLFEHVEDPDLRPGLPKPLHRTLLNHYLGPVVVASPVVFLEFKHADVKLFLVVVGENLADIVFSEPQQRQRLAPHASEQKRAGALVVLPVDLQLGHVKAKIVLVEFVNILAAEYVLLVVVFCLQHPHEPPWRYDFVLVVLPYVVVVLALVEPHRPQQKRLSALEHHLFQLGIHFELPEKIALKALEPVV